MTSPSCIRVRSRCTDGVATGDRDEIRRLEGAPVCSAIAAITSVTVVRFNGSNGTQRPSPNWGWKLTANRGMFNAEIDDVSDLVIVHAFRYRRYQDNGDSGLAELVECL